MNDITFKIIARMKSDFPSKFGIPRQSGLVNTLRSTIIFEPEFRNNDALRGLESYSHIWLIWNFSENTRKQWSPTVRPPRLGGNTRMGVFATRSPFRPNPIGLSCVKILSIEKTAEHGTVIHVSGGDLMDGTPIFDIKPYIPYADCMENATGGFTDSADKKLLQVVFPQHLLQRLPKDKQQAAVDLLSQDMRPSYQDDTQRLYTVSFAGFDIRFTVCDKILTVSDVITLT